MKIEEMEARIMRRVIKDALAAGFLLSVHDGEETTVALSQNADEIFRALRTTDDDRLHFFTKTAGTLEKAGEFFGHVHFVYGNDGYDVIADSSVALEPDLKGAEAVARDLERRA